jgi:hypothetical protein
MSEMDIRVAREAEPKWVAFMIRILTKWRPKALEAGNHALVALADCAVETKDRFELEGVMRLYIDEFLGGLPDFRDEE